MAALYSSILFWGPWILQFSTVQSYTLHPSLALAVMIQKLLKYCETVHISNFYRTLLNLALFKKSLDFACMAKAIGGCLFLLKSAQGLVQQCLTNYLWVGSGHY